MVLGIDHSARDGRLLQGRDGLVDPHVERLAPVAEHPLDRDGDTRVLRSKPNVKDGNGFTKNRGEVAVPAVDQVRVPAAATALRSSASSPVTCSMRASACA